MNDIGVSMQLLEGLGKIESIHFLLIKQLWVTVLISIS